MGKGKRGRGEGGMTVPTKCLNDYGNSQLFKSAIVTVKVHHLCRVNVFNQSFCVVSTFYHHFHLTINIHTIPLHFVCRQVSGLPVNNNTFGMLTFKDYMFW